MFTRKHQTGPARLIVWALIIWAQLAWFGFVEMFIFLAILVVGYVFAWRRGALEWA